MDLDKDIHGDYI